MGHEMKGTIMNLFGQDRQTLEPPSNYLNLFILFHSLAPSPVRQRSASDDAQV